MAAGPAAASCLSASWHVCWQAGLHAVMIRQVAYCLGLPAAPSFLAPKNTGSRSKDPPPLPPLHGSFSTVLAPRPTPQWIAPHQAARSCIPALSRAFAQGAAAKVTCRSGAGFPGGGQAAPPPGAALSPPRLSGFRRAGSSSEERKPAGEDGWQEQYFVVHDAK